MASWHPRACKVCGARRPHVSISKRGLCPTHSRARMVENATALYVGAGPAHDHWLQSTARALITIARKRDAQLDTAADRG